MRYAVAGYGVFSCTSGGVSRRIRKRVDHSRGTRWRARGVPGAALGCGRVATVRLNKFLGESGTCSRREADALISEGRVTLNGKVAELGMQVAEGDEVRLDGALVGPARKLVRPVYIALNKPVGITCTTDRRVEGNIVDFLFRARAFQTAPV